MACRAHLCHLPGLGQVGHSPKGNQWECWDSVHGPMWSGPLFFCHQLSDQPAAWQVDILSYGWLPGQLQLASWLAGWLAGWLPVYWTKCQPDPPPDRKILLPCVWLLGSHRPVVRCTPSPLVDISWLSENPHGPHETAGQVGIWSDVRSGQHHIRCPLNWKSCLGQGKMIDPLNDFYTTKDLLLRRVTI